LVVPISNKWSNTSKDDVAQARELFFRALGYQERRDWEKAEFLYRKAFAVSPA